jgi:hypothetical protein
MLRKGRNGEISRNVKTKQKDKEIRKKNRIIERNGPKCIIEV